MKLSLRTESLNCQYYYRRLLERNSSLCMMNFREKCFSEVESKHFFKNSFCEGMSFGWRRKGRGSITN